MVKFGEESYFCSWLIYLVFIFNEIFVGDRWLLRFLIKINNYKERDFFYKCKWNNLNCYKYKYVNVY